MSWTNFGTQTNSVDPDQTAPIGVVRSDVGLRCLLQRLADETADDIKS